MKYAAGGTSMHCPKCNKIRVCAAIPTNRLGMESGQRWYRSEHPDLNWFRRGRRCLTCDHRFLTAEAPEAFLDELCELREALGEIKQNAEAYVKQAGGAAKSLAKLSESLEVLRALQIYRNK